MANVFTNVGDFRRGKGNRKTRLGPRIQTGGRTKGEKHAQTPDDIALKKLFKLLDKGFTTKEKYSYIEIMRQGEQIRFMNMSVLAEVLFYMNSVGNNVTLDNFNFNIISPFIERLLPRKDTTEGGIKAKDIPGEELEIMKLRLAATFLRYIRYVILLREQAQENLQNAQIEQAQINQQYYE